MSIDSSEFQALCILMFKSTRNKFCSILDPNLNHPYVCDREYLIWFSFQRARIFLQGRLASTEFSVRSLFLLFRTFLAFICWTTLQVLNWIPTTSTLLEPLRNISQFCLLLFDNWESHSLTNLTCGMPTFSARVKMEEFLYVEFMKDLGRMGK